MKLKKQHLAELILLFATFLWALTYPFVRVIVSEIHPNTLMFWRGFLSATVFAIFIFIFKKQQYPLSKLVLGGFYMGGLYYLAYISQAFGLQTIESGRSSFITSLYIILVPLMSPLFNGKKATTQDIVSSVIALFGLLLITNPFSEKGFYVGDLWTMIAALAFALQIHLLQIYTTKYQSYGVFSFLQSFFIGLLAVISLPFSQNFKSTSWIPHSIFGIYGLIYVALFATVITTWLQARFQQNTSAERASLIYVLEPILAMICGYFLLREKVSMLSLVGGGVMLIAVTWGTLITFLKQFKTIRSE